MFLFISQSSVQDTPHLQSDLQIPVGPSGPLLHVGNAVGAHRFVRLLVQLPPIDRQAGRLFGLKRIGLLSAVKIGSVLSCVIGFIAGAIWALMIVFFSSVINMMMHNQAPSLGLAALIILPVFFAGLYAVLGAIITFLSVLLFNIVTGLLGGLDIEVDYTYIITER